MKQLELKKKMIPQYLMSQTNCFLFIADNALLTQSRFILMESILIQFSLFGLLCVLKFRRVMDKPATLGWWIWLTLGIASLTCALWYLIISH